MFTLRANNFTILRSYAANKTMSQRNSWREMDMPEEKTVKLL